MVTADRPEFVKRSIDCFRTQTYGTAALVIYDTGKEPLKLDAGGFLLHHVHEEVDGLPVGALRNNANRIVGADVIVHWDDDDWSHPNRIAEQVALLKETGADCVGYNDMLFWRTRCLTLEGAVSEMHSIESDAWLYKHHRANYALGTSLCYWRSTWEAKQFKDHLGAKSGGTGEDHEWIQDMKLHSTSSYLEQISAAEWRNDPRMIARIHGQNTSGQYQSIESSASWQRVPQWDERLRELFG